MIQLLPFFVFAAALLPLVLNLRYFQDLFWFGDELHLLTQIQNEGLWHWINSTFAENYVPLFKLLWGGSAIVFSGSYFAMVMLLWLTHAFNAALLYYLLKKVGIEAFGALFAALIFALTSTTIESLGWTVQWSALLSNTFFLLSCLTATQIWGNSRGHKAASLFFLVLFLTCGALCFSRGVINCAVLAGSFGIVYLLKRDAKLLSNFLCGVLCLLPGLVAASMIFFNSGGNHHQISNMDQEVYLKMGEFAFNAFSRNPLQSFFMESKDNLNAALLFMGFKLALIGAGLFLVRRSDYKLKGLLLSFLLFDLISSVLLGLGRYHTGMQFAGSSRYQYEYLIALCPFVAVVINYFTKTLSVYFKAPILFVCCALLVMAWPKKMQEWSGWRGRDGRAVLLKMDQLPPGKSGTDMWLGIPPIISFEDAKKAVKEFSLH